MAIEEREQESGRGAGNFVLPYASVPLGPGIHLRCYPMPVDGQRWEFVHVSKQGKASHYDLPNLGPASIIHEKPDAQSMALEEVSGSIGKQLKSVLMLVLSVARDPGFYGISVDDWTLAATEDNNGNGWLLIMDMISRLHGRAVGRVKVVMSEDDWRAVHNLFARNAVLRRMMLGLAVPPPRGETLLMWLPADLVSALHDEANRRNLKPSKIVLEALQERYVGSVKRRRQR